MFLFFFDKFSKGFQSNGTRSPFKQWIILGISLPLLVMAYTNCSNYSDSGGLISSSSSSVCPEGNCALVNGQLMSLKTTSTQLTMACNQDHIEVAGTCNAGDSQSNFIEYGLNYTGNPINWGYGAQAVTKATDARCENGHFNLLVRRPSTTPNCTNCHVDVDLVLKLYYRPKAESGDSSSNSSEAQMATQYTERLTINYGSCNDTEASPPNSPPTNLSWSN